MRRSAWRSGASMRAWCARNRSRRAVARCTCCDCSTTPDGSGPCGWTPQPARSTSAKGEAVRVLIVEDEAALREGLRAQLTQAGFTVDVAQDGEEGLYAGREYPLDVAIIDLGLPKLPGLELIRRLRAEHKSFPILVLTARDRWQDKVEGLQAGADDYVVKPFHFQEVLARVQALLRRSGGWASAELTCGPI